MTAPTRPAVGAQVRIDRVNDQLPIGTTVHFASVQQHDNTTYIKTAANEWTRLLGGHSTMGTAFTRTVIIDSYPDAEPRAEVAARPVVEAVERTYRIYTPGTIITTEELDHLPEGTVVRDADGHGARLTRRADGAWDHQNSNSISHDILADITTRNSGGIRVVDLVAMTQELWDMAPGGSVFLHTDIPTGANRHQYPNIKRADGWYAGGELQERSDFLLGDYRLVWWGDGQHVETPAETPVETDAMRQRIRECIDECVRQHNPTSGHVRDGAWIKLGFEPIPERGASIPARTAYGLPNHSLVEQRDHLFRVDDQRDWPERFSPSGTAHTQNLDIETNVTVIWAAEAEVPIFYSGLDLLHKFWDIYRKMRPLHRWCDYVDDRLRGCDLNDPGEQPQWFAQAEAVVEPEPPIELGRLDTRQLSRATQERVLAAFRAMPAGSVCSGHETYVKTPTTWVRAADPRHSVFDGPMVSYVNVTIDYIPKVRTVAEFDDEPF